MRMPAVLFALTLAASTPAWASASPRTQTSTGQASSTDQADRLRQRLEEIRERLALSPEQVERVRPVLQQEAEKLRALRTKYEGGSQPRRSRLKMARELKDIQSETDEKLAQILTTAQMDELKKMRKERREQRSKRTGR